MTQQSHTFVPITVNNSTKLQLHDKSTQCAWGKCQKVHCIAEIVHCALLPI